jgi:hypothetical protein
MAAVPNIGGGLAAVELANFHVSQRLRLSSDLLS